MVLVTGGTGFIGAHTVVELLNKGEKVVIIDNLSNSRKIILENIYAITKKHPLFYHIDLLDYQATKNIFQKHTIRSVIHFAASKAVGESVNNPLHYYHNNLTSLIYLLQLCREYKVKNFIFSSSCTVYGTPKTLPVTENTSIKKAASPYGNTKQIGEEIIKDFVVSYPNLNAISLRYFNPIGAHESTLIGEFPLGKPQNLIPIITQTGIGLIEKFMVFGNDYNTPDGTCIRDYIHVVDLAKAHILAIDYAEQSIVNYDVFNLGTGKGTSVKEAITTFEKMSGVALNYEITNRRSGDVEKIWADPSKANKVLGWHSETQLEQMIDSAWKWQKAITKNT